MNKVKLPLCLMAGALYTLGYSSKILPSIFLPTIVGTGILLFYLLKTFNQNENNRAIDYFLPIIFFSLGMFCESYGERFCNNKKIIDKICLYHYIAIKFLLVTKSYQLC